MYNIYEIQNAIGWASAQGTELERRKTQYNIMYLTITYDIVTEKKMLLNLCYKLNNYYNPP